jgi:hypothetical protein
MLKQIHPLLALACFNDFLRGLTMLASALQWLDIYIDGSNLERDSLV